MIFSPVVVIGVHHFQTNPGIMTLSFLLDLHPDGMLCDLCDVRSSQAGDVFGVLGGALVMGDPQYLDGL